MTGFLLSFTWPQPTYRGLRGKYKGPGELGIASSGHGLSPSRSEGMNRHFAPCGNRTGESTLREPSGFEADNPGMTAFCGGLCVTNDPGSCRRHVSAVTRSAVCHLPSEGGSRACIDPSIWSVVSDLCFCGSFLFCTRPVAGHVVD